MSKRAAANCPDFNEFCLGVVLRVLEPQSVISCIPPPRKTPLKYQIKKYICREAEGEVWGKLQG